MAVLHANNPTVCLHETPAGRLSAGEGSPPRDCGRDWTPVHRDLHAADVDGVLVQLNEASGRIERLSRDAGPRPVASCADPFGNGLWIIGPSRESVPG